MKLKIFLTILLSLALVFLIGCQMPFSTGAKVKGYLNTVEPTFSENKEALDNLSDELNFDNLNQNNIQSNISSLNEALETTDSAQSQLDSIETPEQAKDLEEKLTQYYSQQEQLLTKIKNTFSYLDATYVYWNEGPQFINDFTKVDTSNYSKMTSQLESITADSKESLNKLKQVETTAISKEYHQELVGIYQSISDFLEETTQAVKDEDSDSINNAVSSLEDKLSEASNAFSDLKLTKQFNKDVNSLNDLDKQVRDEINELKEEFNISS